MNTYIYQMKDPTGQMLHGLVQAENKEDLRKKLRMTNFYFIGAQPCQMSQVLRRRVSLDTLIMFTSRFSSLIDSGIPILSAMHILWRQTENVTMQMVITHLHQSLEEGKKISEALDCFPNVFPLMYRSMFSVAEKAGELREVLKKLAEYLEYQRAIIIKTKKVTLYPTIVVIFAVMVLFFMFLFVVPTFQKVLFQLKVELPLITRIVLGIAKTFRSPVFYLVLGVIIIGIWIIFKQSKKHKKLAYLIDLLKLKIPFIGDILYTMAISRFIHTLSLMISAGVPILESFEVAAATTGNQTIYVELEEVRKQIEHGESLYSAFKEIKNFPVILIEMIGVGEASGKIVNILEKLAAHFDGEADYKQTQLFTIIEPVLIIFVGAIVVFSLFAVYMPIFSIWEQLLKQ